MKQYPLLALIILCACTTGAPEPYGALPLPEQLEWQKMEMNMFVHFGPNTFSGKEWGDGTEAEDMFNPTCMDCRQWASIASAAGFKGIIITAKHHDGFCLWPTSTSTHSVAAGTWRDGRGDVLRDLSEACREQGLKFGVYVSPWDRNHPAYGTEEYNALYAKAVEEVHTGYGEVFEHWFDGACGEGPAGKKQVYDWPLFHSTVRKYSPHAIMFSDVGPGCRWMGNERGRAGVTNWSRLNTEGFEPGAGAPPIDTLQQGNVHGKEWVPAETDVSIRPGWFWKESENSRVKTAQELMDIYYSSVGRNSLLLLNVPPDDRGLIHPADSAALMEFRRMREEAFARDLTEGATVSASAERGRKFRAENVLDGDYDSFWAVPDDILTPSLEISLPAEVRVSRILLQEYIPLGQRVAAFELDAWTDAGWKTVSSGTTIGYKRILLLDSPVQTSRLRLRITRTFACPVLNRLMLLS